MTIPKQDDDFLARLVGGAIVRARCVNAGETVVESDPDVSGHALTHAVERLRERAEKAELERDDLSIALIKARRAYAEVWSDVTRNEIGALDFTPERLRAELASRWLERRVLADGTVPAVGQRVVTVREVAERWGLSHGHDEGKVHEITSLLGGHCHLVECGPEQIGVGMLQLAPAGSDVTCSACSGWRTEQDRRRADAQVFRETQFKVSELNQSLLEARAEIVRLRESAAIWRGLHEAAAEAEVSDG